MLVVMVILWSKPIGLVGQVLETIKKQGLENNTLVILVLIMALKIMPMSVLKNMITLVWVILEG